MKLDTLFTSILVLILIYYFYDQAQKARQSFEHVEKTYQETLKQSSYFRGPHE